ncbi:hypothetical protein K7H91_23370 [Martelella mediterranea]|uniref:hypothetical protein n=1 Tax=Martelella mediterranea TaxID=293089 RepID=UPI001E393AAC|nr:hypothetical protein [Martelella mediterranea]MCD1636701.1 hypothetical protein [Martelella mediterranea]|tara:strand:+ start:2363 stop:2563 length:201 start_codon:yes stop_codon:yes gene_type:complete
METLNKVSLGAIRRYGPDLQNCHDGPWSERLQHEARYTLERDCSARNHIGKVLALPWQSYTLTAMM